MVVIRLARHGAHKAPFYRVVVADQRKRRAAAQQRKLRLRIDEQQREQHAEDRLQKHVDGHPRNRIGLEQHSPERIGNRGECRQIEQHERR